MAQAVKVAQDGWICIRSRFFLPIPSVSALPPMARALLLLLPALSITSGSPLVDDKRLGAVMGAAVTDAAAMPLHWIYDTNSIKKKVGSGDPAFHSPPSCMFYKYPEGENTPYGQQNRMYLATLADAALTTPRINATLMQDAYWNYYGPSDAPCHDKQVPVLHTTGCYWDGSTKGFVTNYQAGKRWPHVGASDTQANAIVHMVPVVAALADQPNLLEEVEILIRVTQDTDKAVAFGLAAARVLRGVILGKSPLEAVQVVAQELLDPKRDHPKAEDEFLGTGLQKMLSELDHANFDVVKEVGQSCDYPFGLWSGSHLVAQISKLIQANATAAYMNATRQTILAGGDSGSRGTFVGAIMGAAVGESALPQQWKAKYLHYDEMKTNAAKWIKAKTAMLIHV